MASGYVNRINRPNTWLHRPSLRREDSPCQLGAVHTWPKADIKWLDMLCRTTLLFGLNGLVDSKLEPRAAYETARFYCTQQCCRRMVH